MNRQVEPAAESDPLAFLMGGGEMGSLMRSMDWSQSSLGPVAGWPQSLRTTVSICLASDLPICVIWGPGLVQLYNDAYRVICGDKHPRSMGQNFSECWKEAWPVIGQAHDSALAGDTAFLETQQIFLERHGYVEECFFTFSFSPIRNEAGRVGGLFHPVIEMTAQMLGERRTRTLRDLAAHTSKAKSVSEALALSAQTLAEYDHDLPFVLLYALDPDGDCARLAGATGMQPDTVASLSTVGLKQNEPTPWPLEEVVRSGSAVRVDDVQQRIGPASFGRYPEPPNAALVLPIIAPGAERPAAIVVAGVSPRLPMNEAYRSFYDLLASGVTTAVANARAHEDERRRVKALAELDRAKTAFFSNVSHEFRTPLTLMLGPLEDALAASDEQLPSVQREQLRVVFRNGLRLQRLVNSLLDFSRIEAGRVRAAYEPTDLASFTADLASNFRSACEKAGLELRVDCTPSGEPVFVDRPMWEKIVLNLLSNAFKFTFEGHITVSMRQAGRAAELRVGDTGTGIPAEDMPLLFERFHRVENARGRTHEGSGIGLALVQELVKLHGGSITAQSEVGRGSTFTVRVPLGSQHLPHEQVGSRLTGAQSTMEASTFVEEALRWLPGDDQRLAPGPALPSLPNGSTGLASPQQPGDDRPLVLVADDNADMRQYVVRLLGQHYRTDAVPDGEAALAAALERPPDLVLTDVMMPRLDGFGLLHALRADPRTSSVPVIMLSARAGEESRVEGMEQGADDYLVKPFSAKELLARVTAHLQMARMRREAGESIRASEERFRALMSATSDAIYQMSADWTEMRHLQGREFIADTDEPSRSWLDKYIHPQDQPHVLEAIHAAIRSKGVFELEHRVMRVDGTLGWTFSRAIPMLDENGEIKEWFGAASDVTDRKQAEDAIRDSAAHFRSMADNAPTMLWVTDPSASCSYLSQRWYEFTGRTPEQDLGFGWLENVHPDDRERTKDVFLAASRLHDPFTLDHRLRRRDGEYRWCVDAGLPRFDAAGQFQGYVGAVNDVHERRLAEEALAEAHRFLHLSIDALSSHIAVLDENGIILAVNDAWRGFADENQYTAHNYGVGSSYVDGCESTAGGCIEAALVTAGLDDVLRGRTTHFELEYACHSPTEERWFVMRVTRFKSPGPVRVVVSHENVSKRRKAEETLKDADRRKDEFLATLAHELRNPLAPIRNGLQIMRLARGNPDAIEQVRSMMERQLGQMVHLIDDLLDLSRISRGQIDLRKQRIELTTAIQQAIETSRPSMELANHELLIELPTGPIHLDADLTRLAQVFSNLLNNAAKFTQRGGQIRLTVQHLGSEAVVSVQDNGIGIPAHMLARVFEMFTQVEGNLERSQGGLGVGLSIVQRLVQMHGGSVEARSDGNGKGSEFVVRLPVASSFVGDRPADHADPIHPGARQRILVADDNVDAAESLATMLSMMGNETQVAHDGLQALDVAAAFRPDVMFLDIGMPKLNGYEVGRRIRQQAWGKDMVLIALTGWGQEEDARRSLEAGLDFHLVKPVLPAALEKLLAGVHAMRA